MGNPQNGTPNFGKSLNSPKAFYSMVFGPESVLRALAILRVYLLVLSREYGNMFYRIPRQH